MRTPVLSRFYRTVSIIFIFLFGFQLSFSQDKAGIAQLKNKANGTGSESFSAAIKLCKHYWSHSFDSSIVYARKAIELSKHSGNDSLSAVADIYLGLSYNRIDQVDSTIIYCKSALSKSESFPKLMARSYSILGVAYRKLGNFNESLLYGNKSIEVLKKEKDSLSYALALGNLSTTYQEMGNPGKAIDYSLESARIFKSLNDSTNLAKRYGTIANIYLDMDNKEKGIQYYNQGISLVDSSKDMWLYMKFVFNMATVYHNLHLYDSAIYRYQIALKHYHEVNDREGIAIANQDIGLSLLEKEEYQKAINHLLTAYQMFSKLSTVRNLSDVLSDIGLAYDKMGLPDSAIYYLNKSVQTAGKYKMVREEAKAHKYLYQVFKRTRGFEKALQHHERYWVLNDSIFSLSLKEKIAELSSKYETDLKDQQIKQLQLDEKINQQKTRTFVISLSLLMVIIILIVAFLYSKKRTQTRLLMVKGQLLEKEKSELDKELEFKKKQLTSHALHMTQKNKILQNIRKAVNEVLPEVGEGTKLKVRKLQAELNKSLRYDKDWEVFSMYFNELNKDFFEKLRSINPALSQYDLKLSALLRMNMNIKESAAVLNIAPDSVKTARYKLRKKLALKPNEDLVKFIMNL